MCAAQTHTDAAKLQSANALHQIRTMSTSARHRVDCDDVVVGVVVDIALSCCSRPHRSAERPDISGAVVMKTFWLDQVPSRHG